MIQGYGMNVEIVIRHFTFPQKKLLNKSFQSVMKFIALQRHKSHGLLIKKIEVLYWGKISRSFHCIFLHACICALPRALFHKIDAPQCPLFCKLGSHLTLHAYVYVIKYYSIFLYIILLFPCTVIYFANVSLAHISFCYKHSTFINVYFIFITFPQDKFQFVETLAQMAYVIFNLLIHITESLFPCSIFKTWY